VAPIDGMRKVLHHDEVGEIRTDVVHTWFTGKRRPLVPPGAGAVSGPGQVREWRRRRSRSVRWVRVVATTGAVPEAAAAARSRNVASTP
jgi:hypothetical protein